MTSENKSNSNAQTARTGSLKLRLLTWFLIVALVPLTVVSIISYRTAKESLRKDAYKSVVSDVNVRVAFISNWFGSCLHDLESQATDIHNTRFLQKLGEAYKSSGMAPDEFTKSYQWHTIADKYSEDLKSFFDIYGYYDVFLIDAEGNILFSVAQESDLGTNLIHGPLAKTRFATAFRSTFESGLPVFSDLEYYAPSNDAIAGFLLEVIVDEDGEKIGAFGIQITPTQIELAMHTGDKSDSGIQAYVIGAAYKTDGVTLRSHLQMQPPGTAQLSGLPRDDSTKFLNQIIDTRQTRLWFDEHKRNGIENINQTEITIIYENPAGESVLGIHKDFSFAGVHWGLIAEIREDVAFAPVSRLKNLIIALVLATGLLVIIIATIITGRIVRPIVRLSRAAKLISQGDLSLRMHTSATDEIGVLASSFNGMVSNLNKIFGDLSTLRAALDEHAIVSITNIRGNIIFANEKFCKLSGYSQDELMGQNHRMVKSDEHTAEFYRELWKTVSDGRVWSGEIKNRAKDGTHYWVDATIMPFKNIDGKIQQYVAIRTDITQVKDAETMATHAARELEQINLELEGQREEAVALNDELTELNESLDSARVDAILATQAKSDFLANMSHEIRTPMTAILGFSENLREGGLSESQEYDAIDTIHKNGEYLLTLINDILDMSKIEAGKMKVECIPFSIHTLITDITALMKVRSDAKKIAFNTEFIGQLPETIQSDPTRLKQILINIIGNAIKFTDEGGVRLITRFVPNTENSEQNDPIGPCLQFDIVDSGVGLTEEQVGNLFQAFSQADTTMTRRFGGTGLGLTISKKFAEMLGGDITIVDSQPGCGTRFRTTIATGSLDGVRMIDQPIDVTANKSSRSMATQSKPLLNCRILLAEDGPDNQRLISFILSKAGAEVVVAENGQIAFDLAIAAETEGTAFDVILMDMQMPVLDGYKATMAIREKDYEGPIIALTAHAMATDREKCINSGCDDFATKPIDRQKLIDMIQQYMQPTDDNAPTSNPTPVNA